MPASFRKAFIVSPLGAGAGVVPTGTVEAPRRRISSSQASARFR